MRIVYICRLFSGLSAGLQKGIWEPRGVPTVYRLIEGLDSGKHDLRLVLTDKDDVIAWPYELPRTFSVAGLSNPVTILPQCAHFLGAKLPKNGYMRELIQCYHLQKLIKQNNPDLLYFDRVNIYAAALAAYLTKIPVVWRVMGVPPAMHEVLECPGLVARVTRQAYKAPFSMVICSQDGSGGNGWMDTALDAQTPRRMLINGVDRDKPKYVQNPLNMLWDKGKTNVLFVSRLVDGKGCLEFVRAACRTLDRLEGSFHFIIVGSGPHEKQMRAIAASNGYSDNIQFLGQIKHSDVLSLHQVCNIYVSLNTMGNLTNANLEAMRSGICIIMPRAPGRFEIDVDTEHLIPDNLVWRINTSNIIEELSDALLYLTNNPTEIQKRGKGMASLANKIIPSWTTRIANEISTLETLIPN